ncbi:MAG: hypothetical protein P8X82_14680 [Gemmatimonadales bacterium]|jgi:hypothetical protein
MNWEAVGAIGEIIGAIAVVVTLIYLAVQVHQNTKSVQASTYQLVAEALADTCFRLVGEMGDEEFDESVLFTGVIRRYENLHFQLRQGNIAEEDAQAFFNSLIPFITSERFGKYWATVATGQHVFHPAFVEYVETKILPGSDRFVFQNVVAELHKGEQVPQA